MRKINIGAGSRWKREGWEILDNGSGKYRESWQLSGVAWNTGLSSGEYDIVYTSHMLEHIPHFKIEQTLSEFNRILKIDGLLRIAVPDLEKAAKAYINDDAPFFSKDMIHDSSHLGIGSMFLNFIVSPGHQTLAVNRECSEVIGSYGHLYAYDFRMLKILLEKWGFKNVIKSEYGTSSNEELREINTIVHGSMSYSITSREGKKKLSEFEDCFITGFDNKPNMSLYAEAVKDRDIPYDPSKEFEYNRRNRHDHNRFLKMNFMIFRMIYQLTSILFRVFDPLYQFIKKAIHFSS